jgi:hypothetical protein
MIKHDDSENNKGFGRDEIVSLQSIHHQLSTGS